MKLDGKRVLVTGGAGFIGSNLVDALVARDCTVRVVDDLTTGREEYLAEAKIAGEVEFERADIRDIEAMRKAADGIDVVFHMAVSNLRVSLYDPWMSHDVNAGGTLALLEGLAASGSSEVERFLYCSSSEAFGTAVDTRMNELHATQPTTVYGASKLAGEWYSLAYGRQADLPVVVARPFNTYGFREHYEGAAGEVIPRMAVRALNGVPPVIFGDGTQTRDFTFVTDTVRGLIAACESDELVGESVNLARGEEVTISRVAELICEICSPGLEPEHADPRPLDVERHLADVTKAREVLGWQAEIGIEDGIGRYVDWLRDSHADLSHMLQESERNWEPQPG